MKKSIFGTVFLAAMIIFNITTSSGMQPIGPKIVLKERLFDAKEVKEGVLIEHSFVFQNKGDLPLEIKSVKPG